MTDNARSLSSWPTAKSPSNQLGPERKLQLQFRRGELFINIEAVFEFSLLGLHVRKYSLFYVWIKNTNGDNEICHILLFQMKSIWGELQVESISRLHQFRLLVATPMTILFDEILLQYNIEN